MKYIKTFRTLAIALTLALLVAIVPTTPALAQASIILSPTSGPIGTTVIVYGTGFTPGIVWVFFKSEARTSAVVNTDGILNASFDVPTFAAPGIADITVRIGPSYVYTQLAVTFFTVTEAGITLSTSSGYVGEEITVSGTGFAASKSVTIYFDDEEVGSTGTNSLGSFTDATFTVPESYQGSHTLKVRDASNNIDTVTFNTKQSITISPTSGTIGDVVTVSGSGFKADEDITITFDDENVATVYTNSKGSFSASFSVPATSSGSHQVEASDDTNENSQTFTTILATASFSRLEGYVGDEVTVSGTGFQASQPVTITFFNENIAYKVTNSDGSFSISFTVPALPAKTYRVRVSDGINTKEDYFKIKILTSASISPITGHVGTEVTVSGVGFIAGRTAIITYDGTQVATATVNTDGTFSTSFTAPASSGGEHSISATDLTNTKSFTFTMESEAPPTPQPLEPEMDIKAEAEAHFDWEDVTDDSLPITYTLQIATDESFSQASIVLEKTWSQSEYTITEAEKLESVSQEAPYYWHVMALDGASNESQWSGTRSFYVAGLSLAPSLSQPLIYTLFGIGALLLGIFGFWLGRKTAYY